MKKLFKKILRTIRTIFPTPTSNNISDEKINTCSTCIWWASEEECNMQMLDNGKRYCSMMHKYTSPNHICECYSEELFEATEYSTQTEELEIDLNQEMEFDKNGPK